MFVYQLSEATAAQRRVPLHLVDATDGITPETGESGGQPQLSKNGAAFGNTTATLVAVGNGLYYVELTAAELNTVGFLAVRYKSAATAEAQVAGQVVSYDPYQDFTANITSMDARLPAALVGGRIDANAGAISADATAADNLETMLDGTGGQTLSLGKLNVVNSAGDAIVASSTGGNGNGINASGNGTGHGLAATGGATNGSGIIGVGQGAGSGLAGTAASGNGYGALLIGSGTGAGLGSIGGGDGSGIDAAGGSGGVVATHGIRGTGNSLNGCGLRGVGGPSGAGIGGLGGATEGAGIRGAGQAGNSPGIEGVGIGNTAGLLGTGGATGAGFQGVGGATSGPGASFIGVAGNANGATFTKQGSGLDIDADEITDIRNRIPAALTVDGNIKADTLRVSGTLQTAGDLKASITLVDDFVDTEITDIQGRLPAALVGGRMDSSVGAMAANVMTAAAAAADLTTELQAGLATSAALATVQADTDDIQTRLPAALTANGNMKSDTLRVAGTVQTAGDLSAQLVVIDDFLDTEIAAILDALAVIDDFLDTEIAAILAAVDTEVGAIKGKTDSLTFTVANQVDSNTLGINGSAPAAVQLGAHAIGALRLVIDAASTTTALVFKTVNGAAASAVDDFYNGRFIVFTSGALAGQATSITDYVGATKIATVPALTSAPAADVTAIIV